MENTTDSHRALSASDLFGIEWQRQHQSMLQNEMHISDRFLVEVAIRLGVKCSNFASDDVRAQYAELRERILSSMPPNACVSDGPADAPKLTRSAEGPFAARNG